ncbi:MAG: hypothetical protein JO028_14660 [Acidobacteriaceae bacterium]|nr:hypothetical protein [Acidobacteriaceae bacterium]
MNEIRQTDFLFLETSCGFSVPAPCSLPATASGWANCPSELALYSLTESARSPFHAEPTQLTTIALLLCAIRDVLGESEQVARRIQNHDLTNDGYEGTDFLKFLPTQGDRQAYVPLIQRLTDQVPDSQFKKAYKYFRKQLNSQFEESGAINPKQILEIIESRLMV